MNELKPCPFCGAQVKLMAIAGEPYPPTYEVNLGTVSEDSDDICYVHCPTCGANWHIEVRVDAFPMDTIAAWNRRPATENKPLTLDELREMDGEPVKVVEDGEYQYGIVSLSGHFLAPKEEVITLCSGNFYLLREMTANFEVFPVPYARKPEVE